MQTLKTCKPVHTYEYNTYRCKACTSVYACTSPYIHMHNPIYVHMHKAIRTHAQAYTHTCTHAQAYMYTCTYQAHVQAHVRMHKPIRTHVRTHKPIRTHVRTHKPIRTHVRTHKPYKTKTIVHYYCPFCHYLLSTFTSCPSCNESLPVKCPFFLELPIQEQLKTLCEKPGFFNKLNYRFNRSKAQDNCYEDIYDGNIYTQNNLLQNDDHISLLWNTDGKPIFKSSHVSIWPLYFLINELPISDRFDMKNMIFAGLWFGPTKPSMLTFLEPFYRSLASLETTGVDVQPHMAANPINIKVHLLLGTCDKPAKSLVQNFMQYNGNYGCGKCEQPGMTYKTSQKGHTHIYPYQTSNPSGPLRTKCETLRYADLAIQTGKPVKGVKGPSWFGALKSYDTVQGLQVDYICIVFSLVWFQVSLTFGSILQIVSNNGILVNITLWWTKELKISDHQIEFQEYPDPYQNDVIGKLQNFVIGFCTTVLSSYLEYFQMLITTITSY